MQDSNVYKKIIEYIEGELPPSEEVNLFSLLAQSEELRAEMREELKISRLVLKDRANLLPPQSVTMNLLSTLGFSRSQTNLNSPVPVGTYKISLWQKLKLPLVFALLSSLITFLIVFFLVKEDSRIGNNLASHFQIVQTPPIIVSSIESVSENNSYSRISVNQISNGKQNHIGLNEEKFDNISDISKNFFETQIKSSDESSFLARDFRQDLDVSSNYFALNPSPNKKGFNENKGKYSLIIRGMQGFTMPNPNVESNDALLFSNMGIGFYFLQFSRVQFGVEFGREIFGQRFINSIDNIDFYYEQKPMLYWGAVGAKYFFSDNLWGIDNLSSTATLLAGGTPIGGPIIKLLLGLDWTPSPSIFGMYLALEGTLLAYQNQNKYYWSKKFGFTYGLMVNF